MTGTYRSEYTDRVWAQGAKASLEKRYTHRFAEEFAEGAVCEARGALVELLEGTPTGISLEQRAYIEACNSLQQLRAWRAKVITAIFPTDPSSSDLGLEVRRDAECLAQSGHVVEVALRRVVALVEVDLLLDR